jgi:hypothetical protein
VHRHAQACSERTGGPLAGDAIRRIFERIIDEARHIERETVGGGPAAGNEPGTGD